MTKNNLKELGIGIAFWLAVGTGCVLMVNRDKTPPPPPEPLSLMLICDQPPVVTTERLADEKGYENPDWDVYTFTIAHCWPDYEPPDDPR